MKQDRLFILATMIAVMTLMLSAAQTSAQTSAQSKGTIRLQSAADVETVVTNAEGGKEIKRVPAEKVVPGSEVIFSTCYENIGQHPAERFSISNPIPAHMLYKAGSAEGEAAVITYSADGGKSYAADADLFVQDENGRSVPALPRQYTHIRWEFESPLAPGAKGVVRFRAILK